MRNNVTKANGMRNTRWLRACAAAMTLVGTVAHAKSLPKDERISEGKLSNGVRWMYRQHDNPPGKMGAMIHVDSGSLNETEAQRGLAHFLEHMCFNGSEHYPPGTLIPYFESIGMEFGADLNAFTSFDQTAYMLFLPDTEEGTIDKGLTVLSDYAFRVSLLQEEIDKERGVVLEESRSGKNAFQRVRDKLWPELFEGSRFAQRLPIGDEKVIATANRDQFEDYYRSWYRPENVTVLLVGDAPVERSKPLIEKWFGAYVPTAPARKETGAEFKPFSRERALVVTDAELSSCDVELMNILAGRPATTTVAQWRNELVEEIGDWIVNRRHSNRINKGEASYTEASSSVSAFFQEAVMVSTSATGEPALWNKMLDELTAEVKRAREHGFTQRELDLARKEIRASAEDKVRTEPTVNARRFLFGMLFAVNQEEPFLSAQQELDLYTELLPSVTLEEVTETYRKHFEPGNYAYVVTMKEGEGINVPTRDEVLAAAKAAWTRKVEPIKEDAAITELLAKMPVPGKVVESATDADLAITSAWLSNGVRVHHRYMDYKKDAVWMTISLAGGDLEETKANSGITQVASLALNDAATSRIPSSAMRDLMTGKNIEVRGGSGQDALTIEISGSPLDLEVGLQKAHALLTDGIIEEPAFKNWKQESLQRIEMLAKLPRFKAMEAMEDLLSGGDPRLAFMTKEIVEAQSVAAAQEWFNRLREKAPIEVAVVGDLPLEKAMPLVELYIGSLPARPRTPDNLMKLRKLARTTGPLSKRVEVDTVTPQAMAIAGFIGTEGRNVQDSRAIELASEIMTSRLVKRIREEMAIVYSIRGRATPSWVYEDSGRFGAGAPCDPQNADKVVEEVHRMFQEFAEKGPTDEELENAKKQVLNNLDTTMREPSFWLEILEHHDLHGRDLKEVKRDKEVYPQFTAEQVKSVFRKYYTPERKFSITAIPTKVTTDQKPAAEAGSLTN